MTSPEVTANQALERAKQALYGGHRLEARRWAEKAISLAPDQEEPWLILAALSAPRASVQYLKRALEINPNSQKARRGMHWAIQRMRTSPDFQRPAFAQRREIVDHSIPSSNWIAPSAWYQSQAIAWTAGLMVLMLLLCMLGSFTLFGSKVVLNSVGEGMRFVGGQSVALARANLVKATRTPTPTLTYTPTPTFTPTLTPTSTSTPTITPTETKVPTKTRKPTKTPTPFPNMPDVGMKEHWVDVNLTSQTAYALKGSQLVRSFVVSTGTWQHPTVTGQYYIYVKYRYSDMAGPGYYLPDVPYVMYFYKGYGLHGTYWHNNFGTPMSHGCINFTIEDAGWLFDFASVGTLVNIHY